MSVEKLLTAAELGEVLGLTAGTILDRFERELPGFRLFGRKGGPVRFRLSDVEEALEGGGGVVKAGVADSSGTVTRRSASCASSSRSGGGHRVPSSRRARSPCTCTGSTRTFSPSSGGAPKRQRSRRRTCGR